MPSTPTPPFSPTIALLTLARIAETELVRALEPHGLTVRKYGVLGHIAGSPGLSLSELARRSHITVQSTHTLIGGLAAAGLVRSEVPSPGLAAVVDVTREGRRVLDAIGREVSRLDAERFGSPGMRALADGLRAATAEWASGR